MPSRFFTLRGLFDTAGISAVLAVLFLAAKPYSALAGNVAAVLQNVGDDGDIVTQAMDGSTLMVVGALSVFIILWGFGTLIMQLRKSKG
jgi:hypothetical protein